MSSKVRSPVRGACTSTAMLPGTVHDGTEGELYDLANDPLQRNNLWSSSQHVAQRDALLDDMWSSLPTRVLPLRACDAPV